MNTNPHRSLTSLKHTPTYKPLPRRQKTRDVEAPWHAPSTSSLSTTTTTDSDKPVVTSRVDELEVVRLDAGIDEDLDQDEEFDPFAAATANRSKKLLGDDYASDNDSNEDDDDEDDDDDDEEAQLRQALKQIQQEKEKEKQLAVKSEKTTSESQLKLEDSIDKRLLSNPLLANQVMSMIKAEESGGQDQHTTVSGGDVKREDGSAGGPVKRKKWTSDSLFSNTALSLGDGSSDPNKKQKLNNDTISSDSHVDFMKAIFK